MTPDSPSSPNPLFCTHRHPGVTLGSPTDAASLLQPRQGARHRKEEEQLLHRAAGEGVRPGGVGLPGRLRPRAHQQQRAVPGDGVGLQRPGGLLPGGLVQPGAGLSLPGGRHGGW